MTAHCPHAVCSDEIRDWILAPSLALPETTRPTFCAQLIRAVRAWRAWMDRGGVEELLRWANRNAPAGVDGAEAAAETWLDVRDRLSGAVDRALRGRSLPDFSTVEEVKRYHRLQLRLRLQGRWRRAPREIPGLDMVLPHRETRTPQQVDARRTQRVVAFAACWLLADVSSGTSTKSRAHWWQMLCVGLDLTEGAAVGPRRNDVTEAVDRMRLRLHVLRPLRRWLEAQQWPAPSLLLDAPPAVGAIAPTLDTLRSALVDAIEAIACSEAERTALRAVLVRGGTLRNRLRHFGTDRTARRAQLWSLAARIGEAAALTLASPV